LVDYGQDPDNRDFVFEIASTDKTLFEEHFHSLPISTIGRSIPNIVKRRVQLLVQTDPFGNAVEFLKDIIRCDNGDVDESNISIPQWVKNTVSGQGESSSVDDLLEYIQMECITARHHVEEPEDAYPPNALYPLMHGPSVQSAIHYTQSYRYNRFHQALPGVLRDNTFTEFMKVCNFPAPEEILCVPVTPSLFRGTNFSRDKIDTASSCILFTSPVHIWALHELLSSTSHNQLTLFSMDGFFPSHFSVQVLTSQ
jgi:hypothetical protein